MSTYNLLIAAVPHNKADMISAAASEAGSWGGTVLMGKRIGTNSFLYALGLDATTLDIVLILTGDSETKKIMYAVKDACKKQKRNFGHLFTISADSFIKNGKLSGGDADMENSDKSQDLICVIVNKGYAEDAMAAARKAGAGGGTILNARGTAREDDQKFFGMHIVPEKEMLMIVAEHSKKAAIMEAVRTLPCLEQAGSGITFSAGVENFTVLGKSSK